MKCFIVLNHIFIEISLLFSSYSIQEETFFSEKKQPLYGSEIISSIFAPQFGAIAQLVEQRTENPCVPGSNPGSTTKKTPQ